MSYEVFKHKVTALIERAGANASVRFHKDAEGGSFFARCSDGTTIIARPGSLKVTVLYGSGHKSMAAL